VCGVCDLLIKGNIHFPEPILNLKHILHILIATNDEIILLSVMYFRMLESMIMFCSTV
jgi:hypothetical protein